MTTDIIAMAKDWFAVKAEINTAPEGATDEDLEPLGDRSEELDGLLAKAKPATPAEAIALLEVARDDFIQFHFGGFAYSDRGDGGEHLVLAAMDGALNVLRALAAN